MKGKYSNIEQVLKYRTRSQKYMTELDQDRFIGNPIFFYPECLTQ